MKKHGKMIAVVLMTCFLTTVASSIAFAGGAQEKKEVGEESVAMILPGPIGDQGWNTKAYLALEKFKENGYTTAYTDEVPTPDNESYLRSYGQQGYKLIVGHGFTFVDQVMKVAPEFPESNYFVTAGLPPEGKEVPSNVSFMQYRSEEGFYLAGMIAGLMTESDTIGYVGAQATPICLADLAAYKKGAREVNSSVEIMRVWVGAWEDPSQGREAAVTMINNGVDVLIHDADLTGTGALRAAKEEGVYMMGTVDDQSDIAPELCLTSVVIDVTNAITDQMERIKEGNFGGIWKPGMAEGIIELAPYGPALPSEVKSTVEERKKEIKEGSFEVPSIYKEIE